MKCLFICQVWPESDSSAGGLRTEQLIYEIKNLGHQIIVASVCQDNSYRVKLENNSIPTFSIKVNCSSFEPLLSNINPDIVLFDRFMTEEQFSWRIKNILPQCKLILDTVDLHGLRLYRQLKLSSLAELFNQTMLRELTSILRSDLILVVSTYEKNFLEQHIPSQHIHLLKPYYTIKDNALDFEQKKDFIFIGNFNHPPNIDSLDWLSKHLWPKISKLFLKNNLTLPSLNIFGAYPTKKIFSYQNEKLNIHVYGKTPDINLVLAKSRVNLAPLRFGAGIKGKILDGWCNATPCVTTRLGAESLVYDQEFGGIVEDDEDSFCQQAYNLYTDSVVWQNLSKLGVKIIQKNFNHQIFIDQLTSILNQVSQKNDSVINRIIWQNQLRSTEYFSRWIEAKNLQKL